MSAPKGDPLEKLLIEIFKMIGGLLKNLFYGIIRLKTAVNIIGFAISFLFIGVGLLFKEEIFSINVPIYIQWLIYGVLLSMPLLYLICLGQVQNKQNKAYDEIFKDIGFIGKDKKYPYLLNRKNDGKKAIYIFKSNIPLTEWKKAKDRLETGLDCSIRQIEEGKNKKIVELITVSSDYKITNMLLWEDKYIANKDGVICIGESDLYNVNFDLNRTAHVLAAGETGSGKSVVLRTMLWQMINKGCKLYMIDFKGGVEFGKRYEQFGEVITERNRALEVLNMLVIENTERFKLIRELETKNLKELNQKTSLNLCRIGIFIDEIGEMLDKKGVSKENKIVMEQLEGALSTLARLGRAAGINLFLGVQRPDANVLTGQIKNNIPVRISGRFADKSASEIVLGNSDACDLPDIKGRFLYKVGNETIEFQAFYFDDDKMLHDIDIEQGSMLVEKDIYKSKKEIPLTRESPKNKNTDINLDLDF